MPKVIKNVWLFFTRLMSWVDNAFSGETALPARVFGWLAPRPNRLRHHDAPFPLRRALASIFRKRRVAAEAWAMRDDGPPKSRSRAAARCEWEGRPPA
jgi:hypothetical protein